jgi:hypothetical protein
VEFFRRKSFSGIMQKAMKRCRFLDVLGEIRSNWVCMMKVRTSDNLNMKFPPEMGKNHDSLF